MFIKNSEAFLVCFAVYLAWSLPKLGALTTEVVNLNLINT